MPDLTIMIKPVSSACNLRCRYCFYTDVAHNRAAYSLGRMTEDTLETLVRRAMRYADRQVSFVFQGGEPTLAGAAFYETLIRLQKEYNTRGLWIQNAIQTNGYALDEGLIELFAREHFLVGVSLDGDPQTHDLMRRDAAGNGTAAAVERTIRRLQDRGVEFNILCVVNRYVAQHPAETFRALRQYRFLQYIACLDPLDGAESDYSLTPDAYAAFLTESFDLYWRAWKEGNPVSIRNFDNYLSILAGKQPENCAMSGRCAQYYLVEADGSVYPCDFYVLDSWRMGNVNQSSFFQLEKSPVSERFRQEALQLAGDCRQCEWYGLCRGGCRRDREPFVQGQMAKNKWCGSYQALFRHAAPRMRQMAQALFQ